MARETREKLLRNSAVCRNCGTALESKHRHDFVTCTCGSLSIDGGLDYVKICGELGAYMDTCVYETVEVDSED